MHALVKDKKERGFTYREIKTPKLKPEEILVKVKAAAICGSDIQFYVWNAWSEKVVKALPFIPGHEGSGVVVDKGREVKKLKHGDRVAFETHLPCGTCYQCRTKMPHICQNMQLFGHTFDGCMAEFCVIPQIITRKIPDKLPYEEAAVLEPMGVSLRAVEEAKLIGDSVLITGCGPIGQFAIGLSRFFGAAEILATDINEKRLEIARRMGADQVINPQSTETVKKVMDLTDGDGVGTVIECSGSRVAIEDGFRALRKGGKYFFLGNPKEPVSIDIMPDIIHKEARIRGLHGREMYETWSKTESILLSGGLDAGLIITHRFGLSEYEEAFEVALSGEGCKVMFVM